MGIITKGMGAIMKGAKKRKTLTLSFPKSKPKPPPRKGEVIIKKPSTTKLADTWQGRRIDAINRKIKPSRGRRAEDYAQEASDIYESKAKTKKSYKDTQKKFYSLPEKDRLKIWKIKARRELKGKK
jgi:hypothetical protein